MKTLSLAAACSNPTLVGGQMLNVERPYELHKVGEIISPRSFRWVNVPGAQDDLNVSGNRAVLNPLFHRQHTVTYNAWWHCVVPTAVLNKTGLPMPYFIKWDDIEFCMRARKNGFKTVTLFGSGVWHESPEKGASDWQVYYNLRNRLITALMYLNTHATPLLLASCVWEDVCRGIREPNVTRLRELAIIDVLRGPDGLIRDGFSKIQEVKKEARAEGSRTGSLTRLLKAYSQLSRNWRRLSGNYKEAATVLVGNASWWERFDQASLGSNSDG